MRLGWCVSTARAFLSDLLEIPEELAALGDRDLGRLVKLAGLRVDALRLRPLRRLPWLSHLGGGYSVDAHLLTIFQAELRTQCEFIIRGAEQTNEALARHDTRGVWFGLQSILISASNASKLFWGSREAVVVEARRPLRESVGVTDDSPLSSRRIRNDFEHFDERLADLPRDVVNV